MKPSDVASLIRKSAIPESVDELSDIVVLQANLADDNARLDWMELKNSPPSFLENVSLNYADRDEPFAESQPFDQTSILRISLSKISVASQLRLFLVESVSLLERAEHHFNSVLIAEMSADETFATHAHRYQLWTEEEVAVFAPTEPFIDPRTFSKDFTQSGLVPSDMRRWLLRSSPDKEGPAFAAWRELACPFLMSSVSSQVSGDRGAPTYHFSGPPSCSFQMIREELVKFFQRLNDGASWIFLEGRDAETRHLLLAAEWARSYRLGSINELGSNALDSARNAYNAYVQSGSRETLKALTDLRKAVVEESQKATQKAQDMSGAIWKDLAVASIPFAFKLFPDADKADNALISGLTAFAAAIFLVYSFFVQVYINYRYFSIQDDSRKIWMSAVCAVLSPEEVEKISEAPLRKSIDDYKGVRLAVGMVYALLVIILVFLGVHEVTAWRSAI